MNIRIRSTLAVAVALAAAVSVAGCTSTATSAPSPEPTVSVEGLPPGVSQATDVPTEVPNDPAQRDNVLVSECAATPDGWRAAGTAENTGDRESEFTVNVFFTTETATVLATGTATVVVPAGETGDWTVGAEFAAPEGTLCVLTGVVAN